MPPVTSFLRDFPNIEEKFVLLGRIFIINSKISAEEKKERSGWGRVELGPSSRHKQGLVRQDRNPGFRSGNLYFL